MIKKIGMLHGKERSFPEAFVERVNSKNIEGIIAELAAKGYDESNITYFELKNGHHDVATWAKAFPAFLINVWGKK